MFDNVCEKYPQILKAEGYSINECLTVSENNLQHGIQSFMFYLVNSVDLHLDSSSY